MAVACRQRHYTRGIGALALLLCAGLLSGTTAAADECRKGKELARKAPAQIVELVRRRSECDHWTGEEPYDRQRAAEIERAVRELRCATLERDEAAARQRHSGNPVALQLLDIARDNLC